jgi:hypothetical protein
VLSIVKNKMKILHNICSEMFSFRMHITAKWGNTLPSHVDKLIKHVLGGGKKRNSTIGLSCGGSFTAYTQQILLHAL